MEKVKSIIELNRIKDYAQRKQLEGQAAGITHIRVSMGTSSIASGAQSVLQFFQDSVKKLDREDILVTLTGEVGLDFYEPIIQIICGQSPSVFYGNVNKEIAWRIFEEHVLRGKPVAEYIIQF